MKENNAAPILRHFGYGHLPASMHAQMAPVAQLAAHIVNHFPKGEERNRALRKLLEARDCLQRAALDMMRTPIAQTQAERYSSEWIRRDTEARRAARAVDPVTGEELPTGSPYSQAHAVIRPAGVEQSQPEPPTIEDGLPDLYRERLGDEE